MNGATLQPVRSFRLTLCLLAVAALAVAGAAHAGPAGPQSRPAATCDADEVHLDQALDGDGVVITMTGCTAQLTCPGSNCIKSCAGAVSCFVGSNYVECDGVKKYCPSCNPAEYPGRPPCNWALCPWCVCRNMGYSSDYCCYEW